MNTKSLLFLLSALFLLALTSCTKKEESSRRSASVESEDGLVITIDSTWGADTCIYFLEP